jgi:hypothetical protein
VSSARIDLGKGDPLQYIYNQGYLFKTGGTNWTPVPYTSTESLIAGAWYPKNRHHKHNPHPYRTAESELSAGLPLHLDRIRMEVWMSGQCVYAELLADLVVQAIGNEKRTKESIINGPRYMCLGLFGSWLTRDREPEI